MVSATLTEKEANTSQLLCFTNISRLVKECGRENYFSICSRQRYSAYSFRLIITQQF